MAARLTQHVLQVRPVWRCLAALVLLSLPVAASARGFDDIASGLLDEALASNLALQGAGEEVLAAEAALAAARARYWPEVSLNARYTVADGGRQIDFPIGQLLNPAYQTLNELLVAQGQAPRFPSLPDQTFDFQRAREQDTRVSLRQPLYAPALPAAAAAQQARVAAARASREGLRRQLRRDVWQAYARYLQAVGRVAVLSEAAAVLDANERAVEALQRQGSVTGDQVLRARAEVLSLRQQLRLAEAGVVESRAWVNALRNRPLDAVVPLPSEEEEASATVIAAGRDLGPRPEREQAAAAVAGADAQVRLAQAARRPQLALGVDAGSQGTDYGIGRGYNYTAASLVVSWKFFDGGAARATLAEARAAARRSASLEQEVAQRLALQQLHAREQLAAAVESAALARARDAAASAALRIAQRQRDEGVIAQVAFLDAQASALAARQSVLDARLALRAAEAEWVFAGESAP